ncbi:unnamed protein product [Cyclocybe aegerita]|uniref:Uncharacterized protein n=1 Tax=Cyclocybe aegerita TaxID=1973307 RepID=A0A8S0WAN5_CYCAE|nr:unnamed protein product [Cyclocybe aegerita]
MQTRSQARKSPPEVVSYDGEGAYTRTTPSATGQGTHIRWEYPDEPSPPTRTTKSDNTATRDAQSNRLTSLTINTDRATSVESFNSLFDGPLSPISEDSSSASGGSFSSLFDGSLSSISSEGSVKDSEPPRTPPRNTAAVLAADPGPIRTTRNNTRASPQTPRPLRRTNVQRWRRGPTGELAPVSETDIDDPFAHPAASILGIPNSSNGANSNAILDAALRQPGSINVDEVFENQLAQMQRVREVMMEDMMAIDMASDDEHDMDIDSVQMHPGQQTLVAPVASSSGANQVAPRLGPRGTELIEESNPIPAPQASAVYPQQWVRNQSSGLRSFPTENLEN